MCTRFYLDDSIPELKNILEADVPRRMDSSVFEAGRSPAVCTF